MTCYYSYDVTDVIWVNDLMIRKYGIFRFEHLYLLILCYLLFYYNLIDFRKINATNVKFQHL